MYSENKWKRNLLTMRGLIDLVIIEESFIIKVIIQGKNENNKEILKKFNSDKCLTQ